MFLSWRKITSPRASRRVPEEVDAPEVGQHERRFAALVLRKRRGGRQKGQRRGQDT
jgi:hypothetical protein